MAPHSSTLAWKIPWMEEPGRLRSMGLLGVKHEMTRVNINILEISELNWTGIGEFNSDDHYIYYCGQEGEGNGTPLQYSCLENPMNRGAWWPAVHGVAKSQTRLSDFPFTFHFHALEKEMATHSSVLAWRIPGTGEPGGLPYGFAQSQTRLK